MNAALQNYSCDNQESFVTVDDFNAYMDSFQLSPIVFFFVKNKLHAGNMAAARKAMQEKRTHKLYRFTKQNIALIGDVLTQPGSIQKRMFNTMADEIIRA